MVSLLVLVLAPLWSRRLAPLCRAEEASREESLSWFMGRVLESLGLEGPPGGAGGAAPRRPAPPAPPGGSWTSQGDHQTHPGRDHSEMILFPGPDSSCVGSGQTPVENGFSYHFQPSSRSRDTEVTSAHFWFYAGGGANSSAALFLAAPDRRWLQAAEGPSQVSSDGWTTYVLGRDLLGSVGEAPLLLQVGCPACRCGADEAERTPFLHLRVQARGPARGPARRRRRSAPFAVPWSPSAVDLLQRPSQQRAPRSECRRAAVEISFRELGWDHWIVRPPALTFYYCHGNCSAGDGAAAAAAAALGITQCCAPVPESMRSLRITTTSDGGYSFKYETLPNIVPEECACV